KPSTVRRFRRIEMPLASRAHREIMQETSPTLSVRRSPLQFFPASVPHFGLAFTDIGDRRHSCLSYCATNYETCLKNCTVRLLAPNQSCTLRDRGGPRADQ